MPQVELPDGRLVEFPDGASLTDIDTAVRRDFPDFFQPVASIQPPVVPPLSLDPSTQASAQIAANNQLMGFNQAPSTVLGEVSEGLQGVGEIAAFPGKLAFMGAADAVAALQNFDVENQITGETQRATYGGNLARYFGEDRIINPMTEPLPVQEFIADVAKTNPKSATAANLASALPELASMMAANPSGAAGRLLALGFSADMIAHAQPMFEDYAEQINLPKEQQDPGRIAELEAGIIQTFGFAPTAGGFGAGIFPSGRFNPKIFGLTPAEQAARLLSREVKRAEFKPAPPETTASMQAAVVAENVRIGNTETARALAAGEKGTDALREQTAAEGVLRQERPEVGLSGLVEGVVQGQPAAEAAPATAPKEVTPEPIKVETVEFPIKDFESGLTTPSDVAKQSTPIDIFLEWNKGKSTPIAEAYIRGQKVPSESIAETTKAQIVQLKKKALERWEESKRKAAEPFPPAKEQGTAPAQPISQPLKAAVGEQTAPVPPVEAKPEMIGMGGAVPSEFEVSPKTPTSIKNAQVDVERAQRGLPPAIQPARRSFGRVWDEAMAKLDQDPFYQDRLINELRDKPRALTDLEDATLLHRQIDLQNEYGKATRDLAQAADDAKTFPNRLDAVEAEKARVAALSDQLLDIYNIGKKVGTETGRGLNARKMLAFEDYTLAKMELDRRSINDGNRLTDAQQAETIRLQQTIERTQKAFDEYVAKTDARLAELAMQEALNKVQAEARKATVVHPRIIVEAERIVGFMEKAADSARNRLKEKFARTSAGVDPTILADLSIVGAAKIARNVVDFAKWSDAMLKDFGEGVKPYLQDAFAASQKLFDDKITQLAKGNAPTVKRAIAKSDIAAQQTQTTASIKTLMDSGKRDAITPLVQKLARMFVESGIRERDPLIDAVHNVLKEIDPAFTRRETMDAISGYGDFRQLTKDEISVKLRDLKGQMQQVAKLEDMQARRPPLKTGVERRIPSPEESRLIKLVNQAKNEFQIPIEDPNTQLKSSLDTLKTRLKNRRIELEGMLKRKEFVPKPRRIVQMDPEANRLHLEMSKAKAAWHEALMKDRLARRSLGRKIFDTGGELLNTSRAILTSADFSAVLRQGGFIALAHPIRAAKSLPAMFKAFASEAGQHAVDREIVARKNYPLYNQSKLFLSEHGQKLSQMEEAYMSRWADKIPLVAGSQRAYTTFLNKLRADSFDAMANALSKGRELTPEEAKAIANFINVATGRGNLGMKENALVGLNTVFFAPRYVASRFQLLAGQPLYRGSARTRALIAQEYARYLIGVGLIYALATMDGADIESDPRSADFGKLRYGNTRLDPISGLAQTSVLIGRLGSGETKRASGKVVPIRGEKVPFGSPNSADVLANFARSKLAPVPGAIVNVLTGKDVTGQPVTAESTARSLMVPLSFPEIVKTMEEQGVPRGSAMAILSLFGMGLQNYDPDRPK